MNRLKYVLGINVPRRIPSNAGILSERQRTEVCKRHQSGVHLSKSTRLLSLQTKRSTEHFRSSYHTKNTCDEHQRNRKIPFPAECIQKHRSSTCQQRRVSSGKRYSGRNSEKLTDPVRHQKCHTITEAGITVEKEPRSYAQMIASYNEMMYTQNSSGIMKDNLSSAMINGIHRSPFSSASVVSLKWKGKSKSSKNTASWNGYNQNAKFSSDTTTTYRGTTWNDKNLMDTIGENKHLPDNTSYATMIEKYSNKLHFGVDSYGLHTNMIHKRNVSTKFDVAPVALMDAKNTGNKSTDFSSSNNSGKVSTKSTEAKRAVVNRDDYDGWVTKVDGIIKDLKRITAKNDSIDSKSDDKWMLQSVNEHAHWLDRVITAHKKKINNQKSTIEKGATTIVPSEGIQFQQSPEPDTTQTLNTPLTPQEELKKQPVQMNTGKPKNPIIEYIKKGPVSSTTRNTSQSPTNIASSSRKEPQIELRMTPSQNESVVSINVDELATKTSGAKEQLLVTISSKKDAAGSANAANAAARSDFASMQISISENTIPVKQIEFSINGKPVSELKSIVARADKLDVLGSMDKVEIRIPSRDSGAVSNQPVKAVGSSAASPVLNLQIAAKFNEPQYQQPRNADLKETPQMPPPAPPPTPTPPLPHVPPKPRSPNLFTPDTTTSGEMKIDVPKSEETRLTKDENTLKMTNDKRSDNVNTPKVDTFVPKSNEAVFQRSDMSIPPSNHPRQPSMNNQNPSDNRSTENRTPSNIIPWWSSEESFKKIRKKGNTPKSALTFKDPLIEPQVKENVYVIPEKEQKLNPDVSLNKQSNPVDIKKADTRSDDVKDAVMKKEIVDEKNKSANMPDTLARSIQVESPQKWKTNSVTKHLKPKSASNSSRIVKRMKYRLKSNLNAGKSSVTVKKDLDTKSSPIPSPKEVTYIAVDPETGNLGLKEEPQVPPSSPKVVENDKQKMAQKANDAKLGEEKTKVERKIEKSAVVQGADPQIKKENKQQLKDTVLKEEKNLGGRVNKSADVSAKGTPSTSKLSLGTNKEEKQRKIDGPNEENLPSKPVNEDQRIKEILKSMKPIEKRKDGTLIDYGVKVSSRKPIEKIKQITRISTNPIAKLNEKIVEPKKAFPGKKQVMPERKDVLSKSKIVEPEKISAVKKPIAASNSETKLDTKSVSKSKMTVEPKKKHVVTKVKNLLDKAKILEPESVSLVKKSTELPNNQINPEIKNVSKPDTKVFTGKAGTEKKPLNTTKVGTLKVGKGVTSTSSDSKINVPNSFIKQNLRSASAKTEKTPLTRTVSKQTDNIKVKPLHEKSENFLNKETTASSKLQTPGKKILTEALKPAEKKKESLQNTIISPSKDTSKQAEKKMESLKGTIASPSKDALKTPEKKEELTRTILTPSKDTSKPIEKKMASREGTIVSSSKDALKPPEKKELERTNLPSSKDTSKQAEKKMESLKGTIASPSKDALKTPEKKEELTRTILTPSKDTSKPIEKKMASREGTIVSSSKDALKPPEKKELERTNLPSSKDTSKQAEKIMESLKGTIASPSKDALKLPEKKSLEGVTAFPSKNALKPAEKKMESLRGTIASLSKDALKPPEKKEELKQTNLPPSKNASKPVEKKMESLEGTIVPPSKDALKLPEKKSLEKVTVSPSKNVLKPAVKKKESSEGTTVPPPKVSDKTESKTDTFRFSRVTRSEESIVSLEKKERSTGAAPLQGTIDKQLSKNQNALTGLTDISKEKKVTSEMSQWSKNDSLKMNVARKSSNKGGSDTGSGGAMGTPTGPAGLNDTSGSSTKKTFDKNEPEKGSRQDENSAFIEESDAYVLLSYKEERPEKNILYSSWLQRFKDRANDDKIL
ncbi:hypothetical protein ANTPLA_LOCUS4351 [Anthophora plagiata]